MRYIALSLLLTGCVQVAPWERGHLAKPQMAVEPFPAQSAILEHVYESREAAGSVKGASSGCGCY